MSSNTDTLLQSVNGNVSNAIKRIDKAEQSVSSLTRLMSKIIKNQETEIALLQKLAEIAQSPPHAPESAKSSDSE